LLLIAVASGHRSIGGRVETGVTFEYLIQTREVTKTDHLGHLGDRDVIGARSVLARSRRTGEEIVAERNSQHLPEQGLFTEQELAALTGAGLLPNSLDRWGREF